MAEFEPHVFTNKICNWMYCRKCGLIRLRNPLTDWCVSKGCNYDEHPQYKAKIHQFTRRDHGALDHARI